MSHKSRSLTPPETPFFDELEIPQGFKKAVGVVQIAMGKLGLAHRKFFNIALANAYEGLGNGQLKFRISAATLAECADFDSRNYQAIYDIFEDLRATPVKRINFDQKSKRRRRSVGSSGLISEFDVIDNGVVEYSFSPEMAKILYQPEEYIWLTLAVQNRFSSKYELSLWENCFRYVGVGSTGYKTVEEWRAILGAEDEYYDTFKHLNQKVLKPSVKGVNEKSGILLEPEFEREKRRIARVKFAVKENPQLSLLDHNEHKRIRETQTFRDARELGLKDVEAIYWIETRSEAYVADAIAYVRGQKSVKGSRGYLIHALHEGYGERSPDDQKRLADAETALAKRKENEARKSAIEAEARQIEFDHANAVVAEGLRLFAERLESEKSSFLKELEVISSVLSAGFVRNRWKTIAFDTSLLDKSDKTDRLILGEIGRKSLEKWGNNEAFSLVAYCQKEGVRSEIVDVLIR